MAARAAQAPAETTETEELDMTPEAPTGQPTVDVDAIIGNEPFDLSAIKSKNDDLLPHEADRDFAPDAVNVGEESPFAKYLGRDIVPLEDETPDPEIDATDATPLNPADPELAQIAKDLGMSVEELLGAAAPVATPEPATEPAPEVPAAVQAQLEALQAQIAELTAKQTQEAQVQALADQEAQLAADRASYEAAQREAYEEQFSHLDDEDREALVDAKTEADLLRWDAQVNQRLEESRAQVLRQQEAMSAMERGYTEVSTALTAANPTMAVEIGPDGYRFADFLVDTHRAASLAYGAENIGPFADYAKAFEDGIKAVQKKAFQHGQTTALTRLKKGEAAPPPLSTRGGGGAPATPKSGLSLSALKNENLFAKEGSTTRR